MNDKYYPKKSRRPLQAIRYFCFECMGWDRRRKDSGKPFDDVKSCSDEMCPLYDFRMGKNPFLKGTRGGNPVSLIKAREALTLNRRKGQESTIELGQDRR